MKRYHNKEVILDFVEFITYAGFFVATHFVEQFITL